MGSQQRDPKELLASTSPTPHLPASEVPVVRHFGWKSPLNDLIVYARTQRMAYACLRRCHSLQRGDIPALGHGRTDLLFQSVSHPPDEWQTALADLNNEDGHVVPECLPPSGAAGRSHSSLVLSMMQFTSNQLHEEGRRQSIPHSNWNTGWNYFLSLFSLWVLFWKSVLSPLSGWVMTSATDYNNPTNTTGWQPSQFHSLCQTGSGWENPHVKL